MFVSPFSTPFAPAFPDIRTHSKTQAALPEKPNNYLNYAADQLGCCTWRITWPEYVINMTGMGSSTTLYKMIFDKNWYRDLKVVKVQRQASDQQLEFLKFLKSIQPEMGFKLVYESDDVVFREEIPDYNVGKVGFDDPKIRQNCIDMMNMCDEVTVTCQYMRDLYREKLGKKEVTVIPNFLPYFWMGYQYNYKKNIDNFEKNKKKPRIVYAGSGSHFDVKNVVNQKDDFSHVNQFVIKNIDKYQFVFIGSYPLTLAPYVQSGKIEFHPWKSLLEFPNFLDSLNAQLFLAPLIDSNFNRSKSDIKYIEASALGVPCMVQDMETYKNAISDLKFTTGEDLEEKVERLLNYKNRANYYKLVPQLRDIASKRFLELPENIGAFVEQLNTPYGSSERINLNKWQ
jgi:hypothetical protein